MINPGPALAYIQGNTPTLKADGALLTFNGLRILQIFQGLVRRVSRGCSCKFCLQPNGEVGRIFIRVDELKPSLRVVKLAYNELATDRSIEHSKTQEGYRNLVIGELGKMLADAKPGSLSGAATLADRAPLLMLQYLLANASAPDLVS